MKVRRSIFLVAAFAALLAIPGAAGWAVWSNTSQAQAQATLLHEQDMALHESLGEIRSDVYLTAILLRDALLEDFPNQDDYRRQFAELQSRTKVSVQTLRRQVEGDELQTAVGKLEAELEGYISSTGVILKWTPEQRKRDGGHALGQRVGRRRDILTLTDRIGQLAVNSSAAQHALIAQTDRSLRSSLEWIVGIALVLGVGVAAFTLLRIRTLERLSETAESELRSLSGQLRTAQEQERKHLSRELHDQVGQMLTGLRMEPAAISKSKVAVAPEVSAALERAKGSAEQTLSVIRNIAMLLRPSMLDDLGLTPALTWLAKEIERSSGIEIRRNIDPRVDQLPDPHRTCIYRVVQEALTNASRYSGARNVDLHVTSGNGWVHASVADDGRGFDPAAEKRKGLGLLGMEERVRELGGQLSVTSVPGRGATIEIHLPEPAMLEGNHATNDDRTSNDSDDRGRSRNRPDRIETSV